MAIAILCRGAMSMWPYHEWLADSDQDLHLFTSPSRLDYPHPVLDEVLARYASIRCYDNYFIEGTLRPELDVVRLHERTPLRALIAQSEWDIIRAGMLRDRLGLPGQSHASGVAYKDKLVMKQTLHAHGVPVAPFREVSTILDVRDHAREHGFPVVVKPRAAGGAMGVTIVDDDDALDALAEQGLVPTIECRPNLMVETFVEGDQYIVDGLVVDGRTVYAWPSGYIGNPANFAAGDLQLAAVMLDVDDPLRARLQEITNDVVDALPSPPAFSFHAEYYLTPDDRLVAGEIAARTGGARIDDMCRRVFGPNPNRAVARHYAGLDPEVEFVDDVERVREGGLGSWVTFWQQPGELRHVPPPPEEPWVLDWRMTEQVGARLTHPLHSGVFFASAVVVGPSAGDVRERIVSLCDWFWDNVQIAPDAEHAPA